MQNLENILETRLENAEANSIEITGITVADFEDFFILIRIEGFVIILIFFLSLNLKI